MRIDLEMDIQSKDSISVRYCEDDVFFLRLYRRSEEYGMEVDMNREEVEKLKDMLEIILKG